MSTGILGDIIGAAITGIAIILATVIAARVTSRRATPVRLSYTKVAVLLPGLDFEQTETMANLLKGTLYPEEWDQTLREMSGFGTLYVVAVVISNPNKIRSGDVELVVPGALCWYFNGFHAGQRNRAFRVGKVDPGKTVRVTAYSPVNFSPSDMRGMEGDRALLAWKVYDDYDPIRRPFWESHKYPVIWGVLIGAAFSSVYWIVRFFL